VTLVSFSPRFRTVSIIPGMENLPAGADADQQRVLGVAQALAHRSLEAGQVLVDLGGQPVRQLPGPQVAGARLGGDHEPGRHREAEQGHLARLAPLPPSRSFMSLPPSAKS
jgi:hypothetical protein